MRGENCGLFARIRSCEIIITMLPISTAFPTCILRHFRTAPQSPDAFYRSENVRGKVDSLPLKCICVRSPHKSHFQIVAMCCVWVRWAFLQDKSSQIPESPSRRGVPMGGGIELTLLHRERRIMGKQNKVAKSDLLTNTSALLLNRFDLRINQSRGL